MKKRTSFTTLIFTIASIMLFTSNVHAQSYTITKILDSHTFELSDGQVVRLIGVKPFECRLNKDFETVCTADDLKQYVQNIFIHYPSQFFLEFDQMRKDPQGRLLAYAFIDTGFTKSEVQTMPVATDYHYVYKGDKQYIFLNASIIKNGYGRLVKNPMNNKHSLDMTMLYMQAKSNKYGLWGQFLRANLGDPCLHDAECEEIDCSVVSKSDASRVKPTCGQNICLCVNYQPRN